MNIFEVVIVVVDGNVDHAVRILRDPFFLYGTLLSYDTKIDTRTFLANLTES